MDLTKYQIKSLRDVVGNEKQLSILKGWLTNLIKKDIDISNCILLIGKSGVGKTSIAIALANDFDIPYSFYDFVDIDFNTVKQRIKNDVRTGGIESKLRLVILDNAHHIASKTRLNLVNILKAKDAKNPIIVIAPHQYYFPKFFYQNSVIIQLAYPTLTESLIKLTEIARKEGLDIANNIAEEIVKGNKSFRQQLIALQSFTLGGVVRRDIDFEEFVKCLLNNQLQDNEKNIGSIQIKDLIEWLISNVKVSKDIQVLAKADRILGRVRSDSYSVLRYVEALIFSNLWGEIKKINFPYRFSFRGRQKELKILQSITLKLSRYLYTGSRRTLKDYLQLIKILKPDLSSFTEEEALYLGLTKKKDIVEKVKIKEKVVGEQRLERWL